MDFSVPDACTRADDEPVAIAKQAIELLEKRIHTMGYQVAMGAEIEFTLRSRHGATHWLEAQTRSKTVGTEPSALREKKDAWFPDSESIAYSYRETGYNHYEVVLTHATPRHGDRHCQTLARGIEAVRHQLQHPAPGYKTVDEGLHHAQVAEWQAMAKRHSSGVSFVGHRKSLRGNPKETSGLHLNVSISDGEGNLFKHSGGAALSQQMSHTIRHVMAHGLYLLCPNTAAFARWHDRSIYQTEVQDKKHQPYTNEETGETPPPVRLGYIENRIPSADCNPYYAVMLQLLGVYAHLTHYTMPGELGGQKICAVMTQHPGWDATRASLRKTYREGGITDLLNTLEPALGDHFADAINRIPPGTEQTAADKNAARRQAVSQC